MDLGLNGRVCLITSASGGIGSATARLLAGEGADLVLAGRRAETLEHLGRACSDLGAKEIVTVVADLTEPASAELILDQAAARRLDVLVNCAGITSTLCWSRPPT